MDETDTISLTASPPNFRHEVGFLAHNVGLADTVGVMVQISLILEMPFVVLVFRVFTVQMRILEELPFRIRQEEDEQKPNRHHPRFAKPHKEKISNQSCDGSLFRLPTKAALEAVSPVQKGHQGATDSANVTYENLQNKP